MQKLRSGLFLFGLGVWTVLYGVIIPPLSPLLPKQLRYWFSNLWVRVMTRWLCISVGVKIEIEGLENIPKSRPFVVVPNHQSTPETFLMQKLFYPAVPALKRELLRIPFFGWAAQVGYPIAIDRAKPKQALEQVRTKGLSRLSDGINVIIYPEGTRNDYPTIGKYARGAAALAEQGNVPILPVVHHSGYIWPQKRFEKRSGVFKVVIGEPIYPNQELTATQMIQKAAEWAKSVEV